MPRDLADVLHHLIPESGPPGDSPAQPRPQAPVAPSRPAAFCQPYAGRVIAVPIGERDVVRAAFVWNLAVEAARLGGSATIVAPAQDSGSSLWPEESIRPMGSEVVLTPATNLGELHREALQIATVRASMGPTPGLIFVRVPPLWLREPGAGAGLLAWTLLLTSSEGRDLLECYGLTRLVENVLPGARVGITVHGTRRQGEAQAAFARLAEVVSRRLGRPVTSYGLLVDDLHVYRAIVDQRPIGMVQPQSPAARSLRSVAEMLLEDARKPLDA